MWSARQGLKAVNKPCGETIDPQIRPLRWLQYESGRISQDPGIAAHADYSVRKR